MNEDKSIGDILKEDAKYIKIEGENIVMDSGIQKQKIGSTKKKYLFEYFDKYTNFINIARMFIKKQPIFYDKAKNWWIWNSYKYKWELIDETDLLNAIDTHTKSPSVNAKIKNEILESLKRVGRENSPKPIKETWIQFKETLVDVASGAEMEASHEFFVTNPIPHSLNKERYVNTPVLDKIFEEWVGKDYVKTLYEIMAYCLLPSYPLSRIFCFIGAGMNGKSKYLELIRRFIGDDNCCSTELDTLLNSRFEITRLHKKLVCQMGETNFNEMNKTSILKKLTGGDLIGFEYKNKDLFHEKNYSKILIATNNLPTTSDKTIGFYRRWLVIDFPNQFSEKKDILADIPDEEYEILSVKLLGILKDLLDKKQFHNEGDIEQRIKKYEEKSNFLNKFINDYCDKDESDFITKSSFYKRFVEWCRENRHREISEMHLAKQMKQIGIEGDKSYIDWDYGSGNLSKKQVRVWRGIKWKNEIKEL